MFIYYENENVIKIVEKLYSSCIELHNLTNTMLLNIEKKAIQINYKKEIFALINDSAQKEQINTELSAINIEINDFFINYLKERKKIDEKISEYRMEYTIVLNRLFKIKPQPITSPMVHAASNWKYED